jgi:hypothetical protein
MSHFKIIEANHAQVHLFKHLQGKFCPITVTPSCSLISNANDQNALATMLTIVVFDSFNSINNCDLLTRTGISSQKQFIGLLDTGKC